MDRGELVVVVPKKEHGPLGKALQVRVDEDLRRRIDSVVLETHHTYSEVIRLLLLAGLELHEKGKRGKK